jgi:hypothetical protein
MNRTIVGARLPDQLATGGAIPRVAVEPLTKPRLAIDSARAHEVSCERLAEHGFLPEVPVLWIERNGAMIDREVQASVP